MTTTQRPSGRPADWQVRVLHAYDALAADCITDAVAAIHYGNPAARENVLRALDALEPNDFPRRFAPVWEWFSDRVANDRPIHHQDEFYKQVPERIRPAAEWASKHGMGIASDLLRRAEQMLRIARAVNAVPGPADRRGQEQAAEWWDEAEGIAQSIIGTAASVSPAYGHRP